MRNTSSHISNHNNNSNAIRGGEKKVMKKSLSVILSTTMALSAFSTAALAATSADFSDLKDLSAADKAIFDKLIQDGIFLGMGDGKFGVNENMTRDHFAVAIAKALKLADSSAKTTFADVEADAPELPYIEAAYKAGIANGYPTDPLTFGPKNEVTREELAVFLVGALGAKYKAEAEAATGSDATVSDWAQGYVATALKYNLLSKNADGTFGGEAKATRYMLALGTAATQAKVAEDNKPAELKVESVTATNLKEVTVKFNQAVDAETAEDETNYSLRSGKTIKSASLSADKKTATLVLNSYLSNNKVDALSANVSAGSLTVSAKNVEFTTADNEIPAVTEVKSLGTKSIKVTFSEPVTGAVTSNFTIDGKAYYGDIEGDGTRSIILTPYSSLSVGEHTVAVSQVKDFADFTSLTSSHKVDVAEDKEAPTITEASATLESVILTFSEDIDKSSIDTNSIYWKSGDDKKVADDDSITKLAGNKFKVNFSDNSLPTGSVVIYVEGVADYSGNAVAKDTKVVVSPEVDKTRPEVKKVKAVDENTIEISFSKDLLNTASSPVFNTDNYVVKNAKGEVISVKDAELKGKVVTLTLYSDLSVGNNSITVKNLKDNTRLENTMLDYSGTLSLGDTTPPEIDSVLVSDSQRRVVIKFNEKMDAQSLANYSNYQVNILGKNRVLTEDMADISVFQDATAVSITFAEKYNGETLAFEDGILQDFKVMAVKDVAGNFLLDFTEGDSVIDLDLPANQTLGFGDYADEVGKAAGLIDTKTVEVKFNKGVNAMSKDAVRAADGTSLASKVSSIVVNGTSTVKIKFTDAFSPDAKNVDFSIDATKVTSIAGNKFETATLDIDSTNILDKVKPTVEVPANGKYVASDATKVITVTFNEELDYITGGQALAANDFEVVRASDNKTLKAGTDFTAEITTDKMSVEITIVLADAKHPDGSFYRVKVLSSKYITDVAGNALTAKGAITTDSLIKMP